MLRFRVPASSYARKLAIRPHREPVSRESEMKLFLVAGRSGVAKVPNAWVGAVDDVRCGGKKVM